LHDILHELENTFSDSRRMKACLDILLLATTDHYLQLLFHESSLSEENTDQEERMAYLLAENIILGMDEPWTVEKLAASGEITSAKLKSIFKKFLGQPAAAFRISVRMQKAKQLLLDNRVNIQEISMRVGYSSPGQFASMFKRKTGCSPSEFRKNGALSSGEILPPEGE
jgi:AraC-like DNA-binding protein